MTQIDTENPWYVQFFLAMGGWTSGLLASIAIYAFSALFVVGNPDVGAVLVMIIGAGFVFVGSSLRDGVVGDFRRHFSIAAVSAGLSAITGGLWFLLFRSLDGMSGEFALGASGLVTSIVLAGLGFLLNRRMGDAIMAFLTTLAVYGVFTASIFFLSGESGLDRTQGFQTITSALWVLAGILLLFGPGHSGVVRAVAAACLIGPLGYFLAMGSPTLFHWRVLSVSLVLRVTDLILFTTLIFSFLQVKTDYTAARGAAIALGGAAAFFLPDYTVTALIILSVGIATSHRGYASVGALALIWTLSRFYYDPQMTLLTKSIVLVVIGLATLVGAFVLKSFRKAKDEHASPGDAKWAPRLMSLEALGVAAVLGVSLALTNMSVSRLETAFKEADTILLPLAPRDPRSLIQGDYMRLRFEQQLFPASSEIENLPRDGEVVLKIDRNRVASFSRMTTHELSLRPDEVRVDFVKKSRTGIRYCPTTFFFQEGDASAFQPAAFAVVKVAQDGATLLVALADENRDIIAPGVE